MDGTEPAKTVVAPPNTRMCVFGIVSSEACTAVAMVMGWQLRFWFLAVWLNHIRIWIVNNYHMPVVLQKMEFAHFEFIDCIMNFARISCRMMIMSVYLGWMFAVRLLVILIIAFIIIILIFVLMVLMVMVSKVMLMLWMKLVRQTIQRFNSFWFWWLLWCCRQCMVLMKFVSTCECRSFAYFHTIRELVFYY